jgi:hypothetical protein
MIDGLPCRRLVSTCLLIVGACIATYAWTRQWTTQVVLERAESQTQVFLEERNLVYGDRNTGVEMPEEAYLASRKLLGPIGMAGGMHYWWNDALPCMGGGALLVAVGALLPFVERRRPRTSDS